MAESKKHKQRIGLVLSAVPGYSETFFRNKIVGLQEHGFEVVLFVTDGPASKQAVLDCQVISGPHFKGSVLKVFVISIFVLIKAVLWAPVKSFRHIQFDRADGFSVIQSLKRLTQNAFLFYKHLDWLHFGFGMLAVGRENVAQAIQARMAVSFRGFDLYLSPLKHFNCYKLLYKKSVCYHVLSKAMKQDLILKGIGEQNIKVISPAIDVSFFKTDVNQFEKSLDYSVKILTVARLHWIKGLEYTLEALAELKRAGIPFHYTLIGTGEERERLVFAAHQLDVLDSVTFTGRLEQDIIREKLTAADIYLQYSIQEGFGNAVLEAQAMGLLCVVSDAEGLQENVLQGQTGWVVPKRQPKLLAAQIMGLMKLPDSEKAVIKQQAITRVQREFHLAKQRHEFVAFYKL